MSGFVARNFPMGAQALLSRAASVDRVELHIAIYAMMQLPLTMCLEQVWMI